MRLAVLSFAALLVSFVALALIYRAEKGASQAHIFFDASAEGNDQLSWCAG
jgi:hypothetical protein